MRFGFLSLVLALGSTGLAGCGSGGGSLGPTNSHADEGSYTSVPTIDALPASINPTTYTPPPSSYDAPPGQANAGGVGAGATLGSVCAELCSDVLGLNCTVTNGTFTDDPKADQNGDPNGDQNGDPNADQNAPAPAATTVVSPTECTNACVQAEAQEACPNELASALSCILAHVVLTCDLLNDTSSQSSLDQDLAANCQTPLLEYASCLDAQPGEPPPGDTCTLNSCGRCTDPCERCICQHDGDDSACTTMCQ